VENYLERLSLALKLFFRWLHNKKIREIDGQEVKPEDEWKTPSLFQQIKKKKTKRLSPYIETEIYDRDELLTASIVKSRKRV
jgi:predicted HTH transcriptional regulator